MQADGPGPFSGVQEAEYGPLSLVFERKCPEACHASINACDQEAGEIAVQALNVYQPSYL